MAKRKIAQSDQDIIVVVRSINEVQKAEQSANDLIQNAKDQKEKMLVEAKKKATSIMTNAQSEAKEQKLILIKKATDQAEKKWKSSKDDTEREVNKRVIRTNKNIENAVLKEVTDLILGG